jgi:hypothetical protein
MPDFALIDSSERGVIFAGIPKEVDKQAAKLLGLDWREIGYLRLVEENFLEKPDKEELAPTGPNQ